MNVLRTVALVLIIVGAVNWGLVGAFQFDLVATIFGGQSAPLARIVYILVGVSGLLATTIFPLLNDRMHRSYPQTAQA
jgi:uncharacterized membrane protein YuzA (DUF378 family)